MKQTLRNSTSYSLKVGIFKRRCYVRITLAMAIASALRLRLLTNQKEAIRVSSHDAYCCTRVFAYRSFDQSL